MVATKFGFFIKRRACRWVKRTDISGKMQASEAKEAAGKFAIGGEFEEHVPRGLKPQVPKDLTYGLKPVPFKAEASNGYSRSL
jgi:hypothetical protein